jgi:hypothetical protein
MPPTKMKKLIEGLVRAVEHLLEELRRRGAVIDVDLTEYEEYRDACPREDA